MEKLKGFQKQYLKGLAHGKKPVVYIGQKGNTPAVIRAVNEALQEHELIKLKFIDSKETQQKVEIAETIEKETASALVGMIGHTAIFYRQQNDPEKRKISMPKRGPS